MPDGAVAPGVAGDTALGSLSLPVAVADGVAPPVDGAAEEPDDGADVVAATGEAVGDSGRDVLASAGTAMATATPAMPPMASPRHRPAREVDRAGAAGRTAIGCVW